MIQEIKLENILPNPFQTRKTEDQEHVRNLAQSISEQGLLQIPSARLNPNHDGTIQLAFGHSRLAAFVILAAGADNPQNFEKMPLNMVELDDQKMFEAAVAENLNRKDLSPIEEAQAMVVYRDMFKKKSAEIGALFHLSDSAVRNKFRLLGLPDEVQEACSTGKITEGAARELLAFQSLPDEVKNQEKDFVNQAIKNEASAELIHSNLSRITQNYGQRMDEKEWKNTDVFEGEGIVGICKGCPQLMAHDKDWCMNPKCFRAKNKAFEKLYLDQASLLSGIAVYETPHGENYYNSDDYNNFRYHSSADVTLGKIRSARCENLRIKYDRFAGVTMVEHLKKDHLVAEGFIKAEIICCKRNGFCTCLKAIDAGVKIQAGEEGAAVAKEDLQEINRQIRAQKKYNYQVKMDLINQATGKIMDAMEEGNLKIWEHIFRQFNSYSDDMKEIKELIYSGNAALIDIKSGIAKNIAHQGFWAEEPKSVLKQLNDHLKEFGIDPLPISFDDPEEEKTGKTLFEVFAEESVSTETETLTPTLSSEGDLTPDLTLALSSRGEGEESEGEESEAGDGES